MRGELPLFRYLADLAFKRQKFVENRCTSYGCYLMTSSGPSAHSRVLRIPKQGGVCVSHWDVSQIRLA